MKDRTWERDQLRVTGRGRGGTRQRQDEGERSLGKKGKEWEKFRDPNYEREKST